MAEYFWSVSFVVNFGFVIAVFQLWKSMKKDMLKKRKKKEKKFKIIINLLINVKFLIN